MQRPDTAAAAQPVNRELGIDATVARGLSLAPAPFSSDVREAWRIVEYIETRHSSLRQMFYRELLMVINEGRPEPLDDYHALYNFLFSSQGLTEFHSGPRAGQSVLRERRADPARTLTLAAYNFVLKVDEFRDGPAELYLPAHPHVDFDLDLEERRARDASLPGFLQPGRDHKPPLFSLASEDEYRAWKDGRPGREFTRSFKIPLVKLWVLF